MYEPDRENPSFVNREPTYYKVDSLIYLLCYYLYSTRIFKLKVFFFVQVKIFFCFWLYNHISKQSTDTSQDCLIRGFLIKCCMHVK